MNIYEKLLEVQSKLKVPKGHYNEFGDYNYRNCEDILEAVKPITQDYKVVIFLTDEVVHIGDRYYVGATAHFVDVESSEKITATAYAREDEAKKKYDGSQLTGSSSSYARKYALSGLFSLDEVKDSDSTNMHGMENASDKVDTTKFYEKPPKEVKCEGCGKVLEPMVVEGKLYPVENIVNASIKKYGKVYCEACRGKADGGHGV